MAPWQVNGVFSLKNLSAKVYDVDVISGPDSIIFDANLSSSIYKKQDGIQVDAFQILMIIKVWMADGCRVSPEYIELNFSSENENQTPFWLYDTPLIPWNEPPEENTPSHVPPWVLAFMFPVMLGHAETQHNGRSKCG